MTQQELVRYSRQILLPALGVDGQLRLKSSKVLVIGAGGLGSPILLYLAAAGIGKIGIVDFDKVDESNLHRQVLYSTADIGKSKVEIAAEKIKALNPYVEVDQFPKYVTSQNAFEIISPYDLVIDGSDNLPTRYLVNDACLLLKKCLVYGAIFQFEGQVSVFNELVDHKRGPNYRSLFPQPPPIEMVPSCGEGGVIGVLPGIIGTMMANEAIKICANIGTTLSGRLLIFDALDFSTRIIKIKPDANQEPIKELIDYEEFCNPKHEEQRAVKNISPVALRKMIDEGLPHQLIDVREPWEFELTNLGGINIPLNDIEAKVSLIKHDVPVIVHCKSGARSQIAVSQLRKLGVVNVMNLEGGILKWREEIDSSITNY